MWPNEKRHFSKETQTATNHHLWLLFSIPVLQRAACGKNENTTCNCNSSFFQLYCEFIIFPTETKQAKSNPTLLLKTHPGSLLWVFLCPWQAVSLTSFNKLHHTLFNSRKASCFGTFWVHTVSLLLSLPFSLLPLFFTSSLFVAQVDPGTPDSSAFTSLVLGL